MKPLVAQTNADRANVLATIKPLVEFLSNVSSRAQTQYSILKTKVLWYFLNREFGRVLEGQMQIVEIIERNQHQFRSEQLLDEYHFLATSLIERGDFLKSDAILKKMALVEVNDFQAPVKQRFLINGALTLGACNGNTSGGVEMVLEFIENLDLFSIHKRALLFHMCSLIHFYRENWVDVHEFQSKFKKALGSGWENCAWVPVIVKSIAYYQQGQFGKCKAYITQNIAVLEPFQGLVPWETSQSLLQLIEAEENLFLKKKVFLSLKDFLMRESQNPENEQLMDFFNPTIWIDSFIEGKSIKALLQEGSSCSLMSIRNAV